MRADPTFYLEGCGYLNNLIRKDGKFIAVIRVITSYSSESMDDYIWMNCEVSSYDYQRLGDLLIEVQKGHCVMLSFKVEYGELLHAHYCHEPEDDCHVIELNCKLSKLRECYVNGQRRKEIKYLPFIYPIFNTFSEAKGL